MLQLQKKHARHDHKPLGFDGRNQNLSVGCLHKDIFIFTDNCPQSLTYNLISGCSAFNIVVSLVMMLLLSVSFIQTSSLANPFR
jgi:hypothetical protein